MHHSKFSYSQRYGSRSLKVEHLENRLLLSASPQLIDLNTEPIGEGPLSKIALDDNLYFVHPDGGIWKHDAITEEVELAVDTPARITGDGLAIVTDITLEAVVDGRIYYRAVCNFSCTHEGLWSFAGDGLPPVQHADAGVGEVFAFGNSVVFGYRDYLMQTSGASQVATQLHDFGNSFSISNWTAVGQQLFVTIDDRGDLGSELWVINTQNSTATAVKDINPGTGDSLPRDFRAANNLLYFTAFEPESGREVWVSDGTSGGTILAKETEIGPSLFSPRELAVVHDELYFSGNDGIVGYEPWRSNGTTVGTILIEDLYEVAGASTPRSSSPSSFQPFASDVVFKAIGANGRRQAWRYDPVSQLMTSLTPNTQWDVQEVFAFDDKILILGFPGSPSIENPLQVWLSDGTLAGTNPVTTSIAGVPAIAQEILELENGFAIITRTDHESRLWTFMSDGTSNDLGQLPSSDEISISTLAGQIIVRIPVNDERDELWIAPDASEAVAKIGEIKEGYELIAAGGRLYYTGWDSTDGFELWSTDGTPLGTRIVESLNQQNAGSSLQDSIAFKDKLYFRTGEELWSSDGTTEGTEQVADIGRFFSEFFVYGDQLYFSEFNTNVVWQSDGTTDGTVRLHDIQIPGTGRQIEDSLYFSGTMSGVRGFFSTNTTLSEAELLKADYSIGSDRTSGGKYTLFHDGKLYSVFGNFSGSDLWTFDLATGSEQVIASNKSIIGLTEFDDQVIFGSRSGTSGAYETWVTDGTPAGTRVFAEFVPGTLERPPITFVPYGSHLYFSVDDTVHGTELWRNDGTPEGGELVLDINPGTGSSSPGSLGGFSQVNGRLLFVAYDPAHGHEWWVINEFNDPPELLVDLMPGELNGIDTTFGVGFHVQHNDHVYFIGRDADTDWELWRTEGTLAGTERMFDLNPGIADSNLRNLTIVGDTLFFYADNGVHGQELWSLLLDASTLVADHNQDGVVDAADLMLWQQSYGSATDLRADGNNSGMVDGSDFLIWQQNIVPSLEAALADFDSDSDVDGADFLKWQRGLGPLYEAEDLTNWQAEYSQISSLSTVATNEPLNTSAAAKPHTPVTTSIVSQQTVTAPVIDLAIEWEPVGRRVKNQPIFYAENRMANQAAHLQAFSNFDSIPSVSRDSKDWQADGKNVAESEGRTLQIDELLERVFGEISTQI